MASMRVGLAHVAVGCNAVSSALCFADTRNKTSASLPAQQPRFVAAFAAKSAVALLTTPVERDDQDGDAGDPRTAALAIAETLQHRSPTLETTRTTTVALHSSAGSHRTGCDGDIRVVAGDSEGNVFVWQRAAASDAHSWQLFNLRASIDDKVRLPAVSVAAVALAETSQRLLYFVSFSDGTLAVFVQQKNGKSAPESVTLLTQLESGTRGIIETLSTTVVSSPLTGTSADENALQEETVVLAAGGVDTKVHLYEVSGGLNAVTRLLALEGHRDWIRHVAFQQQTAEADSSGFILASASQDHRIRLWKIAASSRSQASDSAFTAGVTSDGFLAQGSRLIYTVSFDALLLGHEDWVTSLQWIRLPTDSNVDKATSPDRELALLSASMDNTLIVWTKSTDGLASWSPSRRIGEMGGDGFLSAGALSGRDGRMDLLALNFHGQLERWEQQLAPSTVVLPAISVTGHCAEVTDLSWSPHGDYLVSVSLDQTARVLAPIRTQDPGNRSKTTWHEISRAQVHGYDLNCGCFILGDATTNDRFVSGADEKILRVFETPDAVQRLVQKASAFKSQNEVENAGDGIEAPAEDQKHAVQHAYLPELSLTNKSTGTRGHDMENGGSSSSRDGYIVLSNSIQLPVGDTLSRKTLWPEQRKLYGHGNELLSVASSYAGDLIASACKSREERYAAVRLWNTVDWSEAQPPLEGHKSSVVQLAFSPSDQYLLSVSKDRQFCLYKRQQEAGGKFALLERVKAHRRIIWSCSWSPDSRVFALGSRDQTVSLWSQPAGKWGRATESVEFASPVRAVAFAPWEVAGSSETSESTYLLAVGLETGAIQFFTVSKPRNDADSPGAVRVTLLTEVARELSASAAITRLAWPPAGASSAGKRILAAASSDHSVRLYNVEL